MKNKLEFIAENQGSLISSFDAKASKKDLSAVGGYNLEGSINSNEYLKITRNIQNFSIDWRAYKEDDTKIVVQKNLLENILKKNSDFFFFRNVAPNGSTYIKAPQSLMIAFDGFTIGQIIFSLVGCFIIFFMLVSPLLVTSGRGAATLSGLSTLTLFLIAFICLTKNRTHWRERIMTHPQSAFMGQYGSSSSTEKKADQVELRVSPQLHGSSLCSLYEEMLRHLPTLTKNQTGLKIGWMCQRYGRLSATMNTKIKAIIVEIYAGYIIPFIETENSYIFYFPKGEAWEKLYKDNDFSKDLSNYEKETILTIFKSEGAKLFLATEEK